MSALNTTDTFDVVVHGIKHDDYFPDEQTILYSVTGAGDTALAAYEDAFAQLDDVVPADILDALESRSHDAVWGDAKYNTAPSDGDAWFVSIRWAE